MLKKAILMLAALLLMLAFGIGAAACGDDEETPTPGVTAVPTSTPEPTPVPETKIGVVVCLTGALAGMGPDIRDGFALAANEINAAGGINGSQIKLIVEDSATDSTTGFEVVKKLVEINGVKVILGPMISGATQASGPYVAERGVLIISPSATDPILLADQEWRQFVFRTAPTDAMQGRAVVQLVTEGGYERVAIFAMDNQYGAGVEIVVTENLGAGIEIVSTTRYDPVKLDYLTELQIIKDKNPDVVIHIGYGDDGQIVYRQALELGLDSIQWITVEGVYAPKTLEMAEAAEFMSKAVIGTRAIASGTAFDEFAANFEAEFGHPPNVYAENSYDAMKLAALAIEEAGYEDAAAISAALLEIGQGYQGASGIITFADNGDRLGGIYEVWKVVEVDGVYSYERVKVLTM